jgi:hypothetical protein
MTGEEEEKLQRKMRSRRDEKEKWSEEEGKWQMIRWSRRAEKEMWWSQEGYCDKT